MPTVAVLGLGEAGSRLAGDLLEAGAEVRAFDPEGRDVDGVVRAPDPQAVVAGVDVVLSVNSAAAALGAATAALPALSKRSVYADLNTAGPELKREMAVLVEGAGARFADVALLGAVPATGIRTSALASGTGARAFADALMPLGMPVEVVSELPGDAATLKLAALGLHEGHRGRSDREPRGRGGAGPARLARGAARGAFSASRCSNAWSRAAASTRRARVDEMEAARDLLLDPRDRAAGRDGERGRASCAGGCSAVRAGGKVATMVTQPAEEVRPSERGPRARAGRVRPARPHRARRAAAADRRRRRSPAASPSSVLAGFALKSHYTSTAERAQVVSAVVPDVEVVGTLTLNRAVGGMNAARGGDRRARGRPHRLDADRRLARGDGRPDRAEAGRQGAAVGPAPARAARARTRRRAGARDGRRRAAPAGDARRAPRDRPARADPGHRRTSPATTRLPSSTPRSRKASSRSS